MNLPSCSWSVYDVAWMTGPFSSDTTQDQYDNAMDYCDLNDDSISEATWENDCIDKGIRWSVAYKLGFSVSLIYCVALIAMIAGAWNLYSRMIGSCLFCSAQCLNFGAIIAIGVFRFNPLGILAAQSKAASKYDGRYTFTVTSFDQLDDYVTDGRTYEEDANMITAMFVLMIALCCCSCCCNGQLYMKKQPEHHPVPQQDFNDGKQQIDNSVTPNMYTAQPQQQQQQFMQQPQQQYMQPQQMQQQMYQQPQYAQQP